MTSPTIRRLAILTLIGIFSIGVVIGIPVGKSIGKFMDGDGGDGAPHVCPLPSIEYQQQKLNEVSDPALFDQLDVDGVMGTKTIETLQFYNTGWNAENEKNFLKGK